MDLDQLLDMNHEQLIGAVPDMKKRRTFRKFTYRGVDLGQLLDMTHEQLIGAHVQEQEDVLPQA